MPGGPSSGGTNAAGYRSWLKQFAQWLYSTSHIQVRYSIDYDGVDISKLSPGTRGMVLLLLYLALDVDRVLSILWEDLSDAAGARITEAMPVHLEK